MDSAAVTRKVITSVREMTWFIKLSNTRINYFVGGSHKKWKKRILGCLKFCFISQSIVRCVYDKVPRGEIGNIERKTMKQKRKMPKEKGSAKEEF
jgi:hypothetical protein